MRRTIAGREVYLGEFEEIVLLAVARLDPEAYGMSVRRELEARARRAVSIGAVYATIERLVDKGLLRSIPRTSNVDRDGRARYFFAVTTEGREALDAAERLRARLKAGASPARVRQTS